MQPWLLARARAPRASFDCAARVAILFIFQVARCENEPDGFTGQAIPRLNFQPLFFRDTFRGEGVAAWNFSRESCLRARALRF